MADWKVSKERIELFPHPNADKLELGRLGAYQVVVQKGLYQNGDEVVFIPAKSILPDYLAEGFREYLTGPQKDRVRAIRLRGEYSDGLILSGDYGLSGVPGEDLSEQLGIKEYTPYIPPQMRGKQAKLTGGLRFHAHDAEHLRIFRNEFFENEPIIVTEKIHGTQINILKNADGTFHVTSKGLGKRGLEIVEEEGNLYWEAAKGWLVFDVLKEHFEGQDVQLVGEVVPAQKGYDYGLERPWPLWFKVVENGIVLPYDQVPRELREGWVPVLYRGGFNLDVLLALVEGPETVSGKEKHIREGIVVTPAMPRRSVKTRSDLVLKLINPKYKETGEEFS